MSRYDREAAFFDRVHNFDERHRTLSLITAWAILTGFLTVTFVGPLVGVFTYDWLFGFDPNDWSQITTACLGGSAVLSALWFGVEWLRQVARR